MPDWKKLLRARMERLNLTPETREEVIAELASHLEDCEGDDSLPAERSGAFEFSGPAWRKLSRAIERAKSQEAAMNHRSKALCLVAMPILFSVGLCLLLLDRAAFLQRLIWIACMAVLLCAAALEHNRLNPRTRRFWLPAFFSLTAATLFLLAIDPFCDLPLLFREITLRPQALLEFNSASPRSFYLGWLLAQVPFGALAAFFSRRAGGSRTARIFAGTLPATLIVGTYVVLLPITSRYSGSVSSSSLAAYLLSAMLVWVAAPMSAVAAGASPFLRESTLDAQPHS